MEEEENKNKLEASDLFSDLPSFESTFASTLRTFQTGRNRRYVAQRPPGEYINIIDHIGLIDSRNPAGVNPVQMAYSERTFDMLQRMIRRNFADDIFAPSEEDKAESRLKKINDQFLDKIKSRIKFTKDGLTLDGEALNNVGAATTIGNMIIASLNESIEVADSASEKVNDFFKI